MLYHLNWRAGASLAALAIALPVQPVFAQDAADAPPAASQQKQTQSDTPPADDLHSRRVDYQGEIIVSAQGLEQLDVLAGTSVLEGAELQANLAGQLGETLTKLPGVSATGFSPGASRPVLRGFSGKRVRVLIDGLGAIDVSNTSADHAVTIDPLTAERIEVLRGPAVLLYGSQAIGGAVNVIGKRIPRRVPSEPIHLDALLRADTAGDLRESGVSADMPLGGGFVAHLDGSYRHSNDLEIAGFALAPVLRSELLEHAAEEDAAGEFEEAAELRETAGQREILPNSSTETYTFNGGLAFFAGESSLGFGTGYYNTSYGVPERPGAGHAEGEDAGVSIAMEQWRSGLRGELALGEGFIDRVRIRAGFSDYTHTEFEGAEVGTVFDVQGMEARAQFIQNRRGGWGGSFGVQYYFRDFDAFGEEAFLPRNSTDQFAVFALQEFGTGPVQLEAAARYETTRVKSAPLGLARDFGAFSGALGLTYETGGGLRFGVNLSRATRAPSAEELFSNGPHIATQAFELGDPDLSAETAWGAEAFVHGRVGKVDLNLAVFQSWFDDYIAKSATGQQRDGLPVFAYTQSDARYFGVEGEVTVPLYDSDNFYLSGNLRGDYIRAELANGAPLPRIPPMSLLGAVDAGWGDFDTRVEVQWFDDQTRTAPFETATDGFTYVNASLGWEPPIGDGTVRFMLQADNIFDVTGRRHASFTKDFVPLAGRNIKLSARFSF